MSGAAATFDRSASRRKDIDYLERQLERPSTWLVPVWREQPILLGESLALLSLERARDLLDRSAELVFLGEYAGDAVFGIDLSPLDSPLQHPSLAGAIAAAEPRLALLSLPPEQAEIGSYARAMLYWHSRHRFCGVCGAPTRPRDGGHLRVCSRTSCGAQQFPRTDPCVLVLVHDERQCLLGRQPGWPKGMYSALAGFVEPAESLERAVAREVLEETGVQIENLRYSRSQPWPFPASLMVGFLAEPATREIKLDDQELEDARWFTRAELNEPAPGFFVPPPRSLAGQLIREFIADTAGSRLG